MTRDISMGRSETYEHTADLGLRIFASDLPDLFRTAAAGLFEVIVANPELIRVEEVESVTLSSGSTEDLLADWLNELIFRCETRHRLYSHFDVVVDETGRGLVATIERERGRHRHEFISFSGEELAW